ncbi:MAG: hypothetical protein OEO19_17160 [Gammaproteobacteria bacterium]|nr:hypothetical protein [Gammaproteobacteria bacterium]MDH3447652.1 hypothetical protein [Gammaproteobacteria bacterium]
MNLALERYADNPIIDELVCWPPRSRRILSVRACNVLFRKPFIEVTLGDGEVFQRHFARESFARYWAETIVILDTITRIETISDFRFAAMPEPQKLAREVLENRAECIEECDAMFTEGMYEQFLMQYGEDCKNLPPDTRHKIDHARGALGLSR